MSLFMLNLVDFLIFVVAKLYILIIYSLLHIICAYYSSQFVYKRKTKENKNLFVLENKYYFFYIGFCIPLPGDEYRDTEKIQRKH